MSPSKRWRELRKGDIMLEQLAAYFHVANRAEGKSPATLSWYDQNLNLFVRFLHEQGLSTRLTLPPKTSPGPMLMRMGSGPEKGGKVKCSSGTAYTDSEDR